MLIAAVQTCSTKPIWFFLALKCMNKALKSWKECLSFQCFSYFLFTALFSSCVHCFRKLAWLISDVPIVTQTKFYFKLLLVISPGVNKVFFILCLFLTQVCFLSLSPKIMKMKLNWIWAVPIKGTVQLLLEEAAARTVSLLMGSG